MPIWHVFVVLVILALFGWGATWLARWPKMAAPFRYLIIAVAFVVCVIISLKLLGLWDDVTHFRVERAPASEVYVAAVVPAGDAVEPGLRDVAGLRLGGLVSS